MRKALTLLAASGALALAAAISPSASHADTSFQTVLTGLNNPYGLAFGPDGGLYVAEAGTGGTTTAFTNGNGDAELYGDTGSVAELLNGNESTVISDLPSLAPSSGAQATGLQGITFDSSGNLYGVFGLGGISSQLATLEGTLPSGSNASDLGSLVSLDPSTGTVTNLDNIAAYETTANYENNNPNLTDVESNPYDLTSLPNGNFAVTEGGGNVVLSVPVNGSLPSLLAPLPPVANPEFNGGAGVGGPTIESVPTAIATAPNGDLYVGEYTGFPFAPGAADVFSIDPSTGVSTILASGFTGITGLAVAANGDVYIMDQTTNGLISMTGPSDAQLIEYDPSNGSESVLATLDPSYSPTDLVLDPTGDALYVSTLGSGPGTGQVLRYSLTAVPEASPLALLGLALIPLGLLAARRRTKG